MANENLTTNDGKAWLKREMRQYRGVILFLTFLSVLSNLSGIAFAYLTRYLINSAASGETEKLILFSALVLGLLLLRIFLQTWGKYLSEKVRAKMLCELRNKLYRSILRADYAHIQKYHSAELMHRLTTDLQEIVNTSVGLMPTFVGMLTQCVGAIVALATIDPWFTLIYVVCGGIFAGIAALFRKQIKKRQKEVLEAEGKSRAYMQEGVTSLMTVKAYGVEEKSVLKSWDYTEIYYRKRLSRSALSSTIQAVFSLLGNFGLIFAIIWCGISVLNGNTDYGAILSVVLLLMQFQNPLTGFSAIMPAYYARLASGERIAELENIPQDAISVSEIPFDTYEKMQAVVLENVRFQYDRDCVLNGADLRIEKGQIACLTGVSGSGKSTIFKLLLQIFIPTEGDISLEFIDGKQSLTAEERGLFAYVPQGNFLFSGTIYENLTFFANPQEDTTLAEKIKTALLVANAEFVYDLPQGLHTVLLEGGEGLSEGQMQRLAIARAILSERPILLLDEATSALDNETEGRILENIRTLKDKTCLIVTHRMAATKIADKVFEMQEGKITEKR